MKSNTTRKRMTRQRQVVLEELQRTDTHPTAEELHALVRRRLPRISLGTVYRNLEVLSESGEVAILDLGGGRRRYDANIQEDHYHAKCLGCGRVEDVADSVVTRLDYCPDGVKGFRVTGHQLTFTGFCPECQQRLAQGD